MGNYIAAKKLLFLEEKMRVLLTGANGQLGQDFQKYFKKIKIKYIATDYKETETCQALDITNVDSVKEFLENKSIDCIINCAAYNNVDKAEEEKEAAYTLNCRAPENLAKAAKEIGALYMTYSTDFVFDGEKKEAYIEEDKTNPLSVYGMSKRDGETAVLNCYDKALVVRTSWVFGMGNNNFNKSVINWSKTKEEISVVDDQVSAPTYSWDLAVYSWEMLKKGATGIYHLSNDGEASKYDQAKYVLDYIGWTGTLKRGKTSDFILPAKRAKYSKLSSKKAEYIIGGKVPTWQSGIDRFLHEMGVERVR